MDLLNQTHCKLWNHVRKIFTPFIGQAYYMRPEQVFVFQRLSLKKKMNICKKWLHHSISCNKKFFLTSHRWKSCWWWLLQSQLARPCCVCAWPGDAGQGVWREQCGTRADLPTAQPGSQTRTKLRWTPATKILINFVISNPFISFKYQFSSISSHKTNNLFYFIHQNKRP